MQQLQIRDSGSFCLSHHSSTCFLIQDHFMVPYNSGGCCQTSIFQAKERNKERTIRVWLLTSPNSFKKPSWATPVLRLSLFLYLCKHSNSLHHSQNTQVKHWSSEEAPVKFGVRQIHLNLGFNLHSGPVTLERSLGLSDPKFRKMGINPFPDYSQSYWEVMMNEIMRGK